MLASLDWLVALVLLFALLSLLATSIQEGIANLLQLRAKTLRKGIEALLHGDRDSELVKAIYASPFVRAMSAGSGKEPSYLAAPVFSQAVVAHLHELRKSTTAAATAAATAGDLIAALPDSSELKKVLYQITDQGSTSIANLEREVALYFDAGMERASGWFKRQSQYSILLVAFITAVLFDADAFNMSRRLSTDPALRDGLVKIAEGIPAQTAIVEPTDLSEAQIEKARKTAETANATRLTDLRQKVDAAGLGLPFGRDFSKDSKQSFCVIFANECKKIPGWIITALAISFGAPFWFDLLSKIVRIRAAVKPATLAERESDGAAPAQPLVR